MFSPPLPLWLHKITQQVLKRNLESNCGGRRLKPPITNKSILSLNFAKKKKQQQQRQQQKPDNDLNLPKSRLFFPISF